MTKTILMFAVAGASLGLVIILFKLIKKNGKLAKKLPKNHLVFFLLYAVLGLSGFLFRDGIIQTPRLIGILLLLVSLTGGIMMTNYLYNKWEWSREVSFGRKLLYLGGIWLVSCLTFGLVFLLTTHRGVPLGQLDGNVVWWLTSLTVALFLPLVIKWISDQWNNIPRLKQIKPVYHLPLNESSPFIESGGRTLDFDFLIPLDYGSQEMVKSRVALPFDKSLGEAFHYKLHEHNVVKRFAKKIVIAQNNQRSHLYGWVFYTLEPRWWGWWQHKHYLVPNDRISLTILPDAKVYVERTKAWEKT